MFTQINFSKSIKAKLMRYNNFFSFLLLFAMSFTAKAQSYNLVVATDGSGNYTTVQAAINAAPTGQTAPYTIFIKNGKYREKITVPSTKPFIQLIGESVANVQVYYDDYASLAGGTSASASFTVNANDFSAFNITFSNTFDYDAGIAAGVTGAQAVAVLVNGDRVAFKNCRFQGNQDTLYQNKKGYYKNCYIDGIIDFIFGGGASIFDSCTVYPKSRTGTGTSYITAANTPAFSVAGQTYGYVFRDCKVISNPNGTNYYLGRPWQNSTGSSVPFAENKVVFLNSILNANVLSAGWSIWDAGTITSNITNAEYQSKYFNGASVDVSGRVSWSQQLNSTQAATYTNANILGQTSVWDPCSVYPGICDPAPTYIAVSNFTGTKGVGTATFKWNLSWGINNVKMEVFRSLIRNGTYSKIGEVTSANDTTYNHNFTDNAFPPGQQVYYYLLASKVGFASHITDTLMLSSKPTINTIGSLGAFLQGGGVPSASQNYTVNGVNLSDNVVISCPANFEISLNNATWISSTGNITLPPTAGVLNNTIVYVRLNASTAPGTFSGNILHTTTNGDNVLVPVSGTSQVAPLTAPAFFRSKANGNLSDLNTWETSADSATWVAASFVPTGAPEENITLMPGFTVTVDVSHTVNGKWTVYGTGANVGGAYTVTTGSITFSNNSSLVWNRDGGTLASATMFQTGSTFYITGTGNGVALLGACLLPTISSTQVFHHVILDVPNNKVNLNFNGTLNTINGNFTVISTGVYGGTNAIKIRLNSSATQVINIGGDLILSPSVAKHALLVAYAGSTAATTQAVNINGNLNITNNYSTNILVATGSTTGLSNVIGIGSANPSIMVGMGVTGAGIPTGTFVTAIAGSSLTMSAAAGSTGTNISLTFIQASSILLLSDNGAGTNGKINLKGNLSINNGTISSSGTAPGTINISRTDGVPQFYSRIGGGLPAATIVNVLANSILDVGTSNLSCVANVNANATLRSGSSTGVIGNLTGTRTLSSAANYIFNGSVPQSTLNNFTAASTPNQVNNITINNASGVTLGNSLTVANATTLTNGKLTLGVTNLITNSVTGSSSSYVVTNGAGVLKVNNVGAVNTLFPVGISTTSYTPVTINNAGTADNFSVRMSAGAPAGINVSPQSDSSVNVSWNISEDVAGGSNAAITLQWNASDQNSLFNVGNCAVVHSNGTTIDYSGIFGLATGAGPYTQTGTGFTSFSPFAVTSKPSIILPVQLLSFTGNLNGRNVILDWHTNDELNVAKYDIERSADARNFLTIGMQQANNTANNHYTFVDNNPIVSAGYYRLKIVERDGTIRFSKIILIKNALANAIAITPNPTSDFIKITLPNANGYSIQVLNALGKIMMEKYVLQTEITLPLNNFNVGVYFIKIKGNGETITQRIIKN